ncbi:MAG: rhodanese-like domain-containing protein [Geothrix sp.]|uniref:rhodanese-like domain-containing protein n=1 Tax=Geothrix sp. TaxID=1962974 RepID=UPI0017E58850|nr:rhodanese-like domain-containing protein [Geothrix sp.]NWJ40368.1 rhodanese-like domain-containing protein [Geothrix sp.]WIL21627.1 MAG: rhodanese-like domain-containing protein [Geothrix sp.]
MFGTALAPTTLEGWLNAHPHLPGILLAALCLLILFLVVLPRIASRRRGKGRPVLDPVQVEELVTGSGALVVDLRSAEDFRTGHIRGCLHVPFAEFPQRFTAPDPKARRALVLVDETDELAHQAFDLLTQRGFTWLYVMRGGMKAWRRTNRPLAR